mgnify:CR=1 FL=1
MTTMMKDNDLKRNASGYYDEPCYKTITAPPKPGEIWTHKTSGAYMLVVASVNGVYSTLRLTDVEKEGCIPVMCKTPMYTTPIMLGYCFENMLADFVKTVKGDEFTAVQRAIGKTLGVIDMNLVAPVPHDHIHMLEDKVKALTDENEGLKQSYKDIYKKCEGVREERDINKSAYDALYANFTKTHTELAKANVYKEMYHELLDKLVCARAGAVND